MHPRSRTLCRVAAEGWLAHWLDFAAGRWLPPMPALLEQSFWLDPGDPHRMASAMQYLTQPLDYTYETVSVSVRRHSSHNQQVMSWTGGLDHVDRGRCGRSPGLQFAESLFYSDNLKVWIRV